MAVSVTNPCPGRQSSDIFGTRPVEILAVSFDSAYVAGGEPFDPRGLRYGYGEPSIVIVQVEGETDTGYVVRYDYTNHKLIAFYGDNNNAADGPLIEVAGTPDLSDLQVRLLIIW